MKYNEKSNFHSKNPDSDWSKGMQPSIHMISGVVLGVIVLRPALYVDGILTEKPL